MKVNIIVCLIGVIFLGYFTAKQYIKVINCMELYEDNQYSAKERCYRNHDNKHEVEDWEQYKRDMKDAKFKHDLYEEVKRMNK
ncbi:hypothetical protein ABIA69_004284 [Lysinibacillus parviboronicapiens]|uniref:Uncharacterized protein n=2 Tax=Lysinibacillus parviboronicapiens TaxID=436516 RepID=A0ABV2PQR0_9BACI